MRIEILPRLWIADRKPTKISVIHFDNLHARNLESKSPEIIISTIKSLIQKILEITKNRLEPFTIIDNNIHQNSMGYVVVIAFIVYYGKISVNRAINQVQKKTPLFQLSHLQKTCLKRLKK